MIEPNKQKGLKISLPSPSAALANFVKQAIDDNDFFTRAAEAPLLAMQQSGVNLDIEELTPRQIADFIDTLVKVKAVIAEKGVKGRVNFNTIFGKGSRIVDKSLVMEQSPSAKQSEGSCVKWDSTNESSAKESDSCSKSYTKFQQNAANLTIDDLLRGPLVRPKDLQKLTESLNVFVAKVEG